MVSRARAERSPEDPVKYGAWCLALSLAALASCGQESSCDLFVADTTTCYDGYCQADGADTTFCGCWSQGMDLSLADCTCTPLALEAACEVYDLSEYAAGDLDCALASDSVGNMCAE
jgi:hypothetical protein